MATLLLSLPLHSKRDLVRARQMARHAADLLGYDPRQQLVIAAAAFDLAVQTHLRTRKATMIFEVVDGLFQVMCTGGPPRRGRAGGVDDDCLRLNKPLPNSPAVSIEDVPWMLQKVTDLAPINLFEEMRKLNRELLETLLEGNRHRGLAMNVPKPNVA